MNIGIISCVSKKLEGKHPAKELYVSDLFLKSYAYAIKNYDKVIILSAKYGVVLPEDIIESYELTLNNFSERRKKNWAYDTYHELIKHLDKEDIVYWHCGENYNKYIRRVIAGKQVFPMKGLGIGRQLKWYKDRLNG
jgi:hypothetical protein